ncbi:hypothetical protein CICLE_v10006342mg [Citrus x clementina]|uniref:Uncharacterized protein n=1 Tax=Citrus clementina TaxID=85681 RepID=V4S1M7_CITCL|nr:hypothetical protein CICLE_v10006342mg [Citrus x clementina]
MNEETLTLDVYFSCRKILGQHSHVPANYFKVAELGSSYQSQHSPHIPGRILNKLTSANVHIWNHIMTSIRFETLFYIFPISSV